MSKTEECFRLYKEFLYNNQKMTLISVFKIGKLYAQTTYRIRKLKVL